MVYNILGIKNENPEDFLEYLREKTRQSEEMKKLTSRLAESERELRNLYIDILENGALEDKVNLLASQYLARLKSEQEQEEEDRKMKNNLELLGIKF